ncbi:tol-pal system-associated acyl-CoA thioesterase [Coralliovum pocilloporae]|uniref:tol-pal system-associated acyl-CoA thioesterase n=1 Tax=Coralliovum pocilloporae TaxID=3066369 RepID=UPI003306B6A5
MTDWPDLSGRLVDGTHMLPVRVYYEDTDFTGVVYHANYLKFIERGRTDFLRLLGVHHSELADGKTGEALGFAVQSINVTYRRPARIDDVVEVRTATRSVTGARIVLDQRVFLGDTELVSADVTIVVITLDGRLRRLPDFMRSAFERSIL